MVALKMSILPGELGVRMRDRLRGNSTQLKVVWQRPDGQRLLIDTSTFKARMLDGWLLASVDLQTDQTGKQNLQFVFFVGKPGEGDSVQGSATINAPSAAAAQIAAVWGADLQRVLWDAVLDGIEAAVHRAATTKPGEKLTLQGFHCTSEGFHADVLTGEV